MIKITKNRLKTCWKILKGEPQGHTIWDPCWCGVIHAEDKDYGIYGYGHHHYTHPEIHWLCNDKFDKVMMCSYCGHVMGVENE